MTMALVLIDVQNAFFDGQAEPAIPGAEEVLAAIVDLLARARAAGTPVIFVQHCEETGAFARGSPGWALHPALERRSSEPVVEKTTPDSFHQTRLADLLHGHRVTDLVIAGNQTEFCVDTTVRAARSLGFAVTMAADAHGTWDSDTLSAAQIVAHHNRTLGLGFARVLPAAQIAFN